MSSIGSTSCMLVWAFHDFLVNMLSGLSGHVKMMIFGSQFTVEPFMLTCIG